MMQAKRGTVPGIGAADRDADFSMTAGACQRGASTPKGASRRLMVAHALCLAAALLAAPGCAVDESKEVAQYRSILDSPNAKGVSYTPGDALPIQTAMLL